MVEVVIPWQPGCRHRAAALDWVLDRWSEQHPAWQVTVAPAAGDRWCKAAAVMPAVHASTADLIVVADADVWVPGVAESVRDVQQGAAWAMPHGHVLRLSEQATARVLSGATLTPDLELAERAYTGVHGGGMVVLPRATAVDVPLDRRYQGWGQEDMSWATALTTLVGAPRRRSHLLFHLWHPPQQRMTRRFGSPQGRELWRSYCKAAGNPGAMRELLEGAACSTN